MKLPMLDRSSAYASMDQTVNKEDLICRRIQIVRLRTLDAYVSASSFRLPIRKTKGSTRGPHRAERCLQLLSSGART